MTQNKKDVITTIQSWASPTLFTVVCYLLWTNLSEMKSDIKSLLIDKSENGIKIQNIERRLDSFESDLKTIKYNESSEKNNDKKEYHQNIYATKEENNIHIKTLE